MKTALIIGGNSGIGKAAAKVLAKKGYRTIIHGRNAEKTKAALAEIKAESSNNNVDYVIGDFNTISAMKITAAEIQAKADVIDILVLSTGVIYNKRIETPDGLEAAFVGQYLGRFAMTHLLMPQLKRSNFARIAMVGAPAMKKAKIHFDDLSLKNNFSMLTSMGQAMLASHLFVQEFAKRHKNDRIVINMHHVGIAKTGVTREISPMLRGLFNLIGTSADKACSNTVYLADNDEVKFSGYFLPTPGKPHKKKPIAFDPAIAEKLWNKSLELIA